jgi:hypothetical protein
MSVTGCAQNVGDVLYGTLPTPTSIRLLQMVVEPEESPIQTTLHTIDLEDEQRPSYRALSYVCGPQEPKHTITCNGIGFQIGGNLYNALLRIRGLANPPGFMVISVDAVCIDQRELPHSLTERSQQVQMMGRIFGEAVEVLADLGEEPGGFDALLQVKDIVRGLMEDCTSSLQFLSKGISQVMSTCDLNTVSAGFLNLLGNAYWSRVWMIQENVMPFQRQYLVGKHLIHGGVFSSMMTLFKHIGRRPQLEVLSLDGVTEGSLLMDQQIVASIWGGGFATSGFGYPWINDMWAKYHGSGRQKQKILDLLQTLLRFNASDSRDKLFALLGMSQPEEGCEALKVDYTMKEVDVAQNVSMAMLKGKRAEDLLSLVPSGRTDRPSWVVDLGDTALTGKMIGCVRMSSYAACGESQAELAHFPAQGIVAMRGAVIDTISALSGTLENKIPQNGFDIGKHPWEQVRACYFWTLENQQWAKLQLKDVPECDTVEAVLRTSVADHIVDIGYSDNIADTFESGPDTTRSRSGTSIRQDYNTWMSTCQTILEIWHERDPEGDEAQILSTVQYVAKGIHNPYGNHIFNTPRNRRLGITSGHHLALLAAETEPEDVVAVFAGVRMPYILRPCGDHFKCVGVCYIHGMMDGEALKLPHWKLETSYLVDISSLNAHS